MKKIWEEKVKDVINTKIEAMLWEKIEEVNVNFKKQNKKNSLLNEDESWEISKSGDESIFQLENIRVNGIIKLRVFNKWKEENSEFSMEMKLVSFDYDFKPRVGLWQGDDFDLLYMSSRICRFWLWLNPTHSMFY